MAGQINIYIMYMAEFSAYRQLSPPVAEWVKAFVVNDQFANLFFNSLNRITIANSALQRHVEVAYQGPPVGVVCLECAQICVSLAKAKWDHCNKEGNFPFLYIMPSVVALTDYRGPHRRATTPALRDARGITTQNHSIVFFWCLTHDHVGLFCYDPNGSFGQHNAFRYMVNWREAGRQMVRIAVDSNAFKGILTAFWDEGAVGPRPSLTVLMPREIGVQAALGPTGPSTFIEEGGYCMFYNWIAINYILTNLGNIVGRASPSHFCSFVHELFMNCVTPASYPQIFPSSIAPDDGGPSPLEAATLSIMEKIWTGGLTEEEKESLQVRLAALASAPHYGGTSTKAKGRQRRKKRRRKKRRGSKRRTNKRRSRKRAKRSRKRPRRKRRSRKKC